MENSYRQLWTLLTIWIIMMISFSPIVKPDIPLSTKTIFTHNRDNDSIGTMRNCKLENFRLKDSIYLYITYDERLK